MNVGPSTTVLIIDDDVNILSSLKRALRFAEFDVHAISDPSEALQAVEKVRPDIILLDVRMPISGLDVLRCFSQHGVDAEIIVMTGYGTVEMAVQAVRDGAFDFIGKPFEHPDTLILKIRRALEHRNLVRRTRELERVALVDFPFVLGRSRQMQEIERMVGRVAPTNSVALVTGETGVGKEMVARAIHRYSNRADRPFLAVNCSALSEQLIESELFGHEKGSFTGAMSRHDGLFIEADGGTLFLDEVGEMPIGLQAKLLRVLQEGEVRRVGSNHSKKVDVRLIAATNRDLRQEVARGTFREDLYYRLNVVNLHIPPLRERREDIPALAAHLLAKHQEGLAPDETKRLAPHTLELLERYRWPGNVRELENVVQRALILSDSKLVQTHTLPPHLLDTIETDGQPLSLRVDLAYQEAKHAFVEKFDRAYLEALLERFAGNMSRAAEFAGMDRSNFRKLVIRAGLHRAGGDEGYANEAERSMVFV